MKSIIVLSFFCGALMCMPIDGFSASNRCVVKGSEGKTLILECRDYTDNFKKGSSVKIKTDRKAQVEGC
jgi:hypothetical protein